MVLMWALLVLVILGCVAIWRWGGGDVVTPWADDDTWPLPPKEAAKRFFWYATVAVTAGLASGIVMIGAGGRLAMRLVAITSPEAQGAITEADQIVGKITIDGTLGFIAFNGILGGTLFGLIFMLIRHWLPRGRWTGLAYGLVLLVLGATRVDPLRPENLDFDIVGPGWLSVVVFSAVVVGYGMLVSAVANRYAEWLPQIDKRLKTIVRYIPAYIVWGPSAIGLAIPLLIGSGVAVLVCHTEGLKRWFENRKVLTTGRVVGLVVVAAALPTFLIDIADIVTRS